MIPEWKHGLLGPVRWIVCSAGPRTWCTSGLPSSCSSAASSCCSSPATSCSRSSTTSRAAPIVEVLDTLLLVFIIVELLSAVRRTLSQRELIAEPFLIVGIIASIKEIVVLSVKAAETSVKERRFATSCGSPRTGPYWHGTPHTRRFTRTGKGRRGRPQLPMAAFHRSLPARVDAGLGTHRLVQRRVVSGRGRHPAGRPPFADLVSRLLQTSEAFRAAWESYDIETLPSRERLSATPRSATFTWSNIFGALGPSASAAGDLHPHTIHRHRRPATTPARHSSPTSHRCVTSPRMRVRVTGCTAKDLEIRDQSPASGRAPACEGSAPRSVGRRDR